MLTNEINVSVHLKSYSVKSLPETRVRTINIVELLEELKNPTKGKENIIDSLKTTDINSPIHKTLLNHLEEATLNSTDGLLCVKLTNTSFDIKSIDISKILAYWKYIDDCYIFLIDVDGYNENEYSHLIQQVTRELNLIEDYDKSITYDSKIILTCDKNIFINYNKFNNDNNCVASQEEHVIDSLNVDNESEKKCKNPIIEYGGSCTFSTFNNNKLVFKTLLDNYTCDCEYIEDGKDYFEYNLPLSTIKDSKGVKTKVYITDDIRYSGIPDNITNLILLNENIDRGTCTNFIINDIKRVYENNLTNDYLNKIIDDRFNSKENNTLYPTNSILKYYWVNPNVIDKHKAYTDKRKEVTLAKIESIFTYCFNDNYKFTYEYISEMCGVSVRTIKTYITENQKELIKIHNKNIKSASTPVPIKTLLETTHV